MLQQIRALSAQTLFYGFGHILARSITFLLLPLYTNVFSPAQYGVVSLAYAFMGFMAVALHYGLDAALMKRYIQADDAGRPDTLTTAYLSFVVTSLLVAAALFLLREQLAGPILGGPYGRYLAYIALILCLDVLWSVPQLLLRSENRPGAYLAFSLSNVALSLTLNILFVLKMKMGVEGVLLGNLITSGILFLISFPVVARRMAKGRFSPRIWRQLMRFGLPFLPAGIFAMMMELADRYLLMALTDMQTVGLYSAGYKLGSLMLLVTMGFNMAWHPFFLKQGDSPENRRLFARVTTYVLATLGMVWVMMLVWVPYLIRLNLGPVTFYGQQYWDSVGIVPWIALGYFFHGAYLLQLPGAFLRDESKWVAITRGAGAVVNIGLNLALIPTYGAMGAAWATMASFGLMALLFYLVNRRIFPVDYEWRRLLRIGLLMGMAWMLYLKLEPTLWREVGLTLFYPVGLLLSGFLTAGEWTVLKHQLLR
ncbi:MAG: oligosaccharide flippase family protein [Candidatus Marinimicrobia bacterium]|nr:oligosaccharide flippase family protein [Candidatus Neomarinimicrobiota bacterium]